MFNVFPADEYALLEQPVESAVQVAALGTTPLVQADPTRVLLILSASSQPGQAAIVSTDSGGASGIYLTSPYSSYVQFDYNLTGPLAQAAWYAWVPAGGPQTTLTVLYVCLRRPPQMYGYADVFKTSTFSSAMRRAAQSARRKLRQGASVLPQGVQDKLALTIPSIFGGGD